MTETTPPLVGRDSERERCAEALDRAAAGSASALAILGEAGIGKSRLLADVVESATERGFLALDGRAAEFERELPFGPFLDACDEYVESLDAATATRLAGAGLEELATVFPAFRPLATDAGGVAGAAERYRAFRAVRELLDNMAARAPVALLLDDLHWADDGSLELVGHLLRHPPERGVALFLAARSGALPKLLEAALVDAEREGSVARVPLGPLTHEAAAKLAPDLDRPRFDALFAESGGNPFYLEQLARGSASSIGGGESTGGAEVPSAVIAAISQEIDLLPDAAAALARAAAVAGDPFELDLAARAGSLPEPEALASLDLLLQHDLVRATDAPRRFRFRHPLVRRAVYESSPAGWRLGAHERAAEALGEAGARPDRRAHHVEAAAQPGDDRAAALLAEAAAAVRLRAPATAARWLETALRTAGAGTAPPTRARMLQARASALSATGKLTDAHGALLEACELLPAPSPERTSVLLTAISIEHVIGNPSGSRDRLAAALAELDDGADAIRVRAINAATGVLTGDVERVEREASEAVAAATDAALPQLAAVASTVLAWALFASGRVDAAASELDAAAGVLARLDASELTAGDVDMLLLGGSLARDLGRYPEARSLLELGIALCLESGQGHLLVPLLTALSTTAAILGELGDASAAAERAVEVAALAGTSPLAEAMALRGLAWVAYLRGDLASALTAGDRAAALTGSSDPNRLAASVPLGLAGALVESGDAPRAIELIEGAPGGGVAEVGNPDSAPALELLALAALADGDDARASRAAAEAATLAGAEHPPLVRCRASRAIAAVALARGDVAAAVETARAGAELGAQADAVVEEARARLIAGQALAAAGDRGTAIDELERAEVIFAERGADRFRKLAARELRGLGRISGRARPTAGDGASGLGELSPREREIAELITDRLTNPQIAEALVVSKKTVETHIRNIFRKLDVSSRVDVARAVERSRDA